MKILIVEDDVATGDFLTRGLRGHGIVADLARSCAEARTLMSAGPYDVAVLDVMLPDGNGLDLLAELRKAGAELPALFLSARGDVSDRLRGFASGGDDYLAKPFAFAELVARIRAVSRRRSGFDGDPVLRVADLEIDTERMAVRRAGRRIELSAKQFALAELFARNQGFVLPRALIVERVWGYGFETRSNALDVQIKTLRDRIDRGFSAPLIHTVRGLGYVMELREPAQSLGGDDE